MQLQTVQDFTRWKRESRLLHCRPAGFSKLYKKFRDPDGAWIAYFGEVNGDPTPGWSGLPPGA